MQNRAYHTDLAAIEARAHAMRAQEMRRLAHALGQWVARRLGAGAVHGKHA